MKIASLKFLLQTHPLFNLLHYPSKAMPEPISLSTQSVTSDPSDHGASITPEASIEIAEIEVPNISRQQPIPPPSEPKQYRAIGLVQGQYMPSQEQLTRGTLLAADGTLIDAVLLGRVMSLVKNHLDINQPHLWVVYPRTRQEDGNLHVQILGVWEPENLNQTLVETPETDNTANDGYFSIRGEVIYHSKDDGQVVAKIRQAPRKQEEKPKFFKLKLQGGLPEKGINHFWDLQVQLQGNNLVIKQATNIGAMPVKKKFDKKPFPIGGSGTGGNRKFSATPRPVIKGDGLQHEKTERTTPLEPPKRREMPIKPKPQGSVPESL